MKIPVPDYIQTLVPYTMSKPTMTGGEHRGGLVRLAANENPLGPSPKAAAAIKGYLQHIHQYPDAQMWDLRDAIAARLKLEHDWIVCGNGSSEIMELALRCYFHAGREAIFVWPSFVMYKLLSLFEGGIPVSIPLNNFRIDVDAILARITERTRVVFIGNPNNPTGLLLASDELHRLLNSVPETVLVILDEAYIQFVRDDDYPDSADLVRRHSNLLVVRSFSKFFGLAGLRAGFGFANPELIDYMNRVRQPYNMNVLAQVGSLAALADREHHERTLAVAHAGLEYLCSELEDMGLEHLKSQANFVLFDVGTDGREVCAGMYKQGVEARAMADYGLPTQVRVSVGLQRENEAFIEALRKVLGR